MTTDSRKKIDLMTLRNSLICKSDLILAASVVFFLESKMKFFLQNVEKECS